MNYLAHAYFSFENEDILIGNMISDFVKGKNKLNYSSSIQNGIMLHRSIDAFTDNHIATKEAKKIFAPLVRLYSGALVDVVYDHFLALDTTCFQAEDDLKNFVQNTYAILQKHFSVLPFQFQQMLPYMQNQNWLYNYQFIWGIEKSFKGIVRRANYLETSDEAFIAFQKNYTTLQQCYNNFAKDIKHFAKQQFNQLTT
ncbi:MAG: ACP phosphodiesterase [Chitinophagales bacterium]|nr:ACP phosphodiesterase [Chitinophagales bacterium]